MSKGAERMLPWVALLLPPAAWMLLEYGLGAAMGLSCRMVGNGLGLVWGGIALLTCAGAGGIAWSLAPGAADANPPARPWLARVALVGAAVFALAIALQTLATAIVPSCAR